MPRSFAPSLSVLTLVAAFSAAAQSPAPPPASGPAPSTSAAPAEEAGRAYGAAVTEAVSLAETLVRIEQQCPKLKSTMDYRDMVADDRKRVEAQAPELPQMVAALVPPNTDALIKALGGCDAHKLTVRHGTLQERFAQAALGLMQGTWMPKK
jgi:hypothetical protein